MVGPPEFSYPLPDLDDSLLLDKDESSSHVSSVGSDGVSANVSGPEEDICVMKTVKFSKPKQKSKN